MFTCSERGSQGRSLFLPESKDIVENPTAWGDVNALTATGNDLYLE